MTQGSWRTKVLSQFQVNLTVKIDFEYEKWGVGGGGRVGISNRRMFGTTHTDTICEMEMLFRCPLGKSQR